MVPCCVWNDRCFPFRSYVHFCPGCRRNRPMGIFTSCFGISDRLRCDRLCIASALLPIESDVDLQLSSTAFREFLLQDRRLFFHPVESDRSCIQNVCGSECASAFCLR